MSEGQISSFFNHDILTLARMPAALLLSQLQPCLAPACPRKHSQKKVMSPQVNSTQSVNPDHRVCTEQQHENKKTAAAAAPPPPPPPITHSNLYHSWISKSSNLSELRQQLRFWGVFPPGCPAPGGRGSLTEWKPDRMNQGYSSDPCFMGFMAQWTNREYIITRFLKAYKDGLLEKNMNL